MEHEILKELIVNIIVTIIFSIATWIFLNFTKNILYPWIEKRCYKGLEVKGIWTATAKLKNENYEKTEFHEHFKLEQNGKNLTGEYIVKTIHENKSESITHYKLSGYIIQNYVTITCIVDSKREVGLINFLLQISITGDKMMGHANWLNRAGTEIEIFENIEFSFQNKK